MALFGVDEWIERGEAFSGYFGMFSRLSVFEAREGRLGRRRFLTGAPSWAAVPGSAALVLASIGVTSFDGAQEGALSDQLDVQPHPRHRLRHDRHLPDHQQPLAGDRPRRGRASLLARHPRHAHGQRLAAGARAGALLRPHLIPIALAYIVAHYFSAFIYQEQAQFTYILSDPLGNGSDLFGTAGVRSTMG